jgi:cholesterol oxidase
LWDGFGVRKVVSVHPLGGCVMANNPHNGVVDTQGRVYKADGGPETVYQGLHVMDASVIPGPVGVNPTFTIVAMAVKIASAIS